MAAPGNAVAPIFMPSAFGQLSVRVVNGRRLVTLPTGQQACRQLMANLCINVRYYFFFFFFLLISLYRTLRTLLPPYLRAILRSPCLLTLTSVSGLPRSCGARVTGSRCLYRAAVSKLLTAVIVALAQVAVSPSWSAYAMLAPRAAPVVPASGRAIALSASTMPSRT
jgi:hypothetical protein